MEEKTIEQEPKEQQSQEQVSTQEAPKQEDSKEKSNVFSNENVHFSVHKKPNCVLEFQVEATANFIAPSRKKAIKEIAKQVSLPGFRKGRAPDALIVKKFPKEVDGQWQKLIADASFRECGSLFPNVPLLQDASISFDIKRHSIEEGAKLSLFMEIEPSVPVIDPKKIELEAIERKEVNEKNIDAMVRQVTMFFSEWKPITGRNVQEGDFVLLNVDVFEEDGTTKELFKGTRFEVAKESMAKWMYDLLIGASEGKPIEGVSTPDEDASQEEKEELSEKKVRLTVEAIQEAILPKIDGTLLKGLGVKSEQELKEQLRKILNKQADKQVREELRRQVSDKLLNDFPFDLPKTLIEKETQFRMRQLSQDPEFQSYWASLKKEEQHSTISSIYQQSEKAVMMFYLCRQLISLNNIPIGPQDAQESHPKNILETLVASHDPHSSIEKREAEAFSRVILEKAEDFLIDHATIIPKKSAPKKEEEQQEKTPSEKSEKPTPKKKAPPKKKKEDTPSEKSEKPAPKKKATPKKKKEDAPSEKSEKPAPKKKAPPKKKKEDTASEKSEKTTPKKKKKDSEKENPSK